MRHAALVAVGERCKHAARHGAQEAPPARPRCLLRRLLALQQPHEAARRLWWPQLRAKQVQRRSEVCSLVAHWLHFECGASAGRQLQASRSDGCPAAHAPARPLHPPHTSSSMLAGRSPSHLYTSHSDSSLLPVSSYTASLGGERKYPSLWLCVEGGKGQRGGGSL